MVNESTVPVVVPEGKTATDLTLGELDAASFHLKQELSAALEGAQRYAATIELLYRWSRRTDPKVKRESFRDYDTDDAAHALRWDLIGEDEDVDPTTAASTSDSSASP